MKKIIISAVLIMTLLAFVSPAAAGPNTRVGERITLFQEPPLNTFIAGQPFHIAHGFGTFLGNFKQEGFQPPFMIGISLFTLEVDGVYVNASYIEHYIDTYRYTMWVFNFPNGMTAGSHTFKGHWFTACGIDCKNPSTLIEFFYREVTIIF
jgi:hypothetical protein